jgi:hypothetical protein
MVDAQKIEYEATLDDPRNPVTLCSLRLQGNFRGVKADLPGSGGSVPPG